MTQERTNTQDTTPTSTARYEPPVDGPDDFGDPDLDVRSAVNQYQEESARREAHSICLIGCGEAGSKLAGVFRLKPDFVSTYLASHYPVRAVVMDTQSDLADKMNELFSWRDPRVQVSFDPPPPTEYGRLLGAGPPDSAGQADERQGSGYTVGRTGGAGGFTLLGRASAIYNILENEQAADTIRGSLADGGVFSRENNGYLLTLSGLVAVRWLLVSGETDGRGRAGRRADPACGGEAVARAARERSELEREAHRRSVTRPRPPAPVLL